MSIDELNSERENRMFSSIAKRDNYKYCSSCGCFLISTLEKEAGLCRECEEEVHGGMKDFVKKVNIDAGAIG